MINKTENFTITGIDYSASAGTLTCVYTPIHNYFCHFKSYLVFSKFLYHAWMTNRKDSK